MADPGDSAGRLRSKTVFLNGLVVMVLFGLAFLACTGRIEVAQIAEAPLVAEPEPLASPTPTATREPAPTPTPLPTAPAVIPATPDPRPVPTTSGANPLPTAIVMPISPVADQVDIWLPAERGRGSSLQVSDDVAAAAYSLSQEYADPDPDLVQLQVVPGSLISRLYVDGSFGRIEVITWILDQPGAPLQCSGFLGSESRATGCTTSRERNRVDWIQIWGYEAWELHNVQADVATIVISTFDGNTIGTPVVSQTAFAVWDEAFGKPADMQFLDDRGTVVHSVWFDEDGGSYEGTRQEFEQSLTSLPEGEPIPFPTEAPDGDIFVAIGPALGNGPEAQALFAASLDGRNRFERVDGSLSHIGTAQWALGSVELFVFDALNTNGEESTVDKGCLYAVGDSNEYFDCGDYAIASLSQEWSETAILDARPDAAWIVVDTRDDVRIVSPVVSNIGYLIWQRQHGRTARISLLDADLEEIWSTNG